MRTATWLAAFAASGILFAQSDPPARVARLNFVSGPVSMQPAGLDDWAAAEINRPLTTGDRLWAADDGRAELHIGSTAIRLDERTGFSFLNLDDRNVQLQVSQGSLNVRLRRLDDDQTFEIDTPDTAFTLLRPGDYRVDVSADGGSTLVRVRAGDGEVSGGGQAFPVHARQQARISAGNPPAYDVTAIEPPDGWDNWCAQRDQREDRAESTRYVSREVIGYEDLDAYGYWRPMPGYGTVWVPRGVRAGWAPYRYGHWVWVEPWGWTWVDDAPWGFAPFHYGRWVYVGETWAWIPGPPAPRPVYSPALVAWVGGPHFSLSVSIGGGGGGVAWFPLGPGEVYRPAYHASPTYVNNVNVSNTVIRNVNVTNVYNVTNVRYVNQTAPGAVTAVSQETFAHARPVGAAAVAVPPGQAATAQVAAVAPVAPRRESLAGPRAAAVVPPASVMNRRVVARRTPPPPPVPFAARQTELARQPGRPLAPETVNSLRRPEPARPEVRPAMPARTDRPMERPVQRQMERTAPAQAAPERRQPGEQNREKRDQRKDKRKEERKDGQH